MTAFESKRIERTEELTRREDVAQIIFDPQSPTDEEGNARPAMRIIVNKTVTLDGRTHTERWEVPNEFVEWPPSRSVEAYFDAIINNARRA